MGILSQPLTWLLPGLIVGLLAYLYSRNARKINRPLLLILGLVTLGLYAQPFPISSDSQGDTHSIALFFTSLLLLPALAWFSAALLVSNLLPGGNLKSASNEENENQPSPGWSETGTPLPARP